MGFAGTVESFLFLSRADGCLGFMAGTGQAIVVSGGDVLSWAL